MPHLCGAQLFHVTRVVPCLQRNLKFPRSLPGISMANWVLHLPFLVKLATLACNSSRLANRIRKTKHRSAGASTDWVKHADF